MYIHTYSESKIVQQKVKNKRQKMDILEKHGYYPLWYFVQVHQIPRNLGSHRK